MVSLRFFVPAGCCAPCCVLSLWSLRRSAPLSSFRLARGQALLWFSLRTSCLAAPSASVEGTPWEPSRDCFPDEIADERVADGVLSSRRSREVHSIQSIIPRVPSSKSWLSCVCPLVIHPLKSPPEGGTGHCGRESRTLGRSFCSTGCSGPGCCEERLAYTL